MRVLRTALAALILLATARSEASVQCDSGYPAPEALQRAFELGAGVVAKAEALRARVALVARVGLDLKRYGVRYTHVGWLWKPDEKASWRVVHQLDVCGTPAAKLYDTGPANFYMDGLSEYQSLMLIPSAETQTRLHAALEGPLPRRLLGQRYNFFSDPFSPTDQNCAAWALELLAAGLAPRDAVQDRAGAQQWLAAQPLHLVHVEPRWYQKLYVNLLLRSEARLADQADAWHYRFVSADTVMVLLLRADARTTLVVVDPVREQASAAQQQP